MLGLYETLCGTFNDDVRELRKILIKKILDEGNTIESYDLISAFMIDKNGGMIGREFELQFTQFIYRVKSALPSSKTEEIVGDFLEVVIKKESHWADGWAKWYEKDKARDKYLKADKEFSDFNNSDYEGNQLSAGEHMLSIGHDPSYPDC
jgi:hypothetical protein